MSELRPLKETDFMRFEDAPMLPGHTTRRVRVISKSQDCQLGWFLWLGRWRQYVFEPALGTVFNVGCLADLADRLGYLNTMHREDRKKAKTEAMG